MQRRIPVIGLILATMVLLVARPLGARADSISNDPQRPTPLALDMTGTVPANGFDYLSFTYPGDGSVAQLTMTYQPTNAAIDPQLGFNVYFTGDDTLVGQGTPAGYPLGTKYLTFSTTKPGTYLLQLYDYADTGIAFHLIAQGLPAQNPPFVAVPVTPTEVPIPTPLPQPGSVESSVSAPLPVARAQNITLPGNSGGSFNYYDITSANGGSVTLTLSVSPDIAVFNKTAGFNVYQGGTWIGQSVISNSTPWTGNVTFTATRGTDYLVQVYNYDSATTISYSLIQS